MPINKMQGLKGLKSVNDMSPDEYEKFMKLNSAVIAQHDYNPQFINQIYANAQYVSKYGLEDFKVNPDPVARADKYNRDSLNDAFNTYIDPHDEDGTINLQKGVGSEFNQAKYSRMSDRGMQQVMESDWLNNQELKEARDEYVHSLANPKQEGVLDKINNVLSYQNRATQISTVQNEANIKQEEARNAKKLEKIYNEDLDYRASQYQDEINNTLTSSNIALLPDSVVNEYWNKYIMDKNSDLVKLGLDTYLAYKGQGETKDLSIDDKRRVLAEINVLSQYFSPYEVATQLNNEAKDYVAEHQWGVTRAALNAKGVAITGVAYLGDQIDGIFSSGLKIADVSGAPKPIVFKDDDGNVIDSKKVYQNQSGIYRYIDENGDAKEVKPTEVNRYDLHMAGYNTDGSEDMTWLSPVVRNRAERTGILFDSKEAKYYDELGVSPYVGAYKTNDERSIGWDIFNMVAFGMTDAVTAAIPGKAFGTIGRLANFSSKGLRMIGNSAKAMGRFFGGQNRAGQLFRSSESALGIAQAYTRGSFEEDYARNLSEADEKVQKKIANDVITSYNNDEQFKTQIDAQIQQEAQKVYNQILNQAKESNPTLISLPEEVRQQIYESAKNQVLSDFTEGQVEAYKNSDEYGKILDEAMESAGHAAWLTFAPEATKYMAVNLYGFRRVFFENKTSLDAPVKRYNIPAGLRKIGDAFDPLSSYKKADAIASIKAPNFTEVATDAGKKKVVATDNRPKTFGQKAKAITKIALNQTWGGAWTNGTDDMMTDAAQNVADNNFDYYLDGTLDGKSVATTLGLWTGLQTYWNGAIASMADPQTFRDFLIGGLGVWNAMPNFANIASLTTKEGRQAYRQAFQQQYKRDSNGVILRDEAGNPLIEPISRKENWRDRAAYFIQNGIVNDYYGGIKQEYRNRQSEADFVNNLLDENQDFDIVTNLISSEYAMNLVDTDLDSDDDESDNSRKDNRSLRFVRAMSTFALLNSLSKNPSDALKASSIYRNAIATMEEIANRDFNPDTDAVPTDELTQSLLSRYFRENPSEASSGVKEGMTPEEAAENARIREEAEKKAYSIIINNAKSMKETYDLFNKAGEEVEKAEKALGREISPDVKYQLQMNWALDKHWRKRLDSMKSEIGDSSDYNEPSGSDLIHSMGSIKNARALADSYERQENELDKKIEEESQKIADAQKKLDDTVEAYKKNTDQTKTLSLQTDAINAANELANAKMNQKYYKRIKDITSSKKESLQNAIDDYHKSGSKGFRVLSADEIMALDPVTRARMLDENNTKLYNKKQLAEIEKLKKQLLTKDPDALNKIKDIARLSQRVKANQEAYTEILRNPEAAAYAFKERRTATLSEAAHIMTQRKEKALVIALRKAKNKNEALDIIKKADIDTLNFLNRDKLFPEYEEDIKNEYEKKVTLSDIISIIEYSDKKKAQGDDGDAWARTLFFAVLTIANTVNTKDELLEQLAQTVESTDNNALREDLELVLDGLEKKNYTMNKATLESRKRRKERAEREREEAEEKKKAAEEAAKKAAEEAAKKEEEKKTEAAKRTESEKKKEKPEDTDADDKTPWDKAKESDAKIVSEEDVLDGEEDKKEEKSKEEVSDEKTKEDDSSEGTKSVADTGLTGIIDNGDGTVIADSSAIADKEATDIEGVTNTPDTSSTPSLDHTTEDAMKESKSKASGNVMPANVMPEFNYDELRETGKLVKRKGKHKGDELDKFNAWMENAGIHLQNIVDHEVGRMLQDNLHLKIQFMVVNNQNNATHDSDMQNHFFLVTEYTDAVKKHHDDSNGGVITANGKQYLIIGITGYGNSAQRNLYDIIFSKNPRSANGIGLMWRNMGDYFKKNPGERFYVDQKLSTEAIQNSMTHGTLVHQLDTDSEQHPRSIIELLKDEKRNPYKLTIKDLGWGIQTRSGFLSIGNATHIPQHSIANNGRAFVFIPASDNAYIPVKITPVKYQEIKNGRLKEKITDALNQLTAPSYEIRKQGLAELLRILYLSPDTDATARNIILTKNSNVVSFTVGRRVVNTFTIDSSFDRAEFLEAFWDFNPRINITMSVLHNADAIDAYAEAGALDVDVATLSTAGSLYDVKGLNSDGTMIEAELPKSKHKKKITGSSDYRNSKEQMVFQHKYYTVEEDGYSLNGEIVTDPDTIRQLDYIKKINDEHLVPEKNTSKYNYYVLDASDNPKVIEVDKNTYEVRELTDEQSKDFVSKMKKKDADTRRDDAAGKALEGKTDISSTDDTMHKDETSPSKPVVTPSSDGSEGTASLAELLGGKTPKARQFRGKLKVAIKKAGWKDVPKGDGELVEYLRAKDIPVDAIGTSDDAISAWLHTIECR